MEFRVFLRFPKRVLKMATFVLACIIYCTFIYLGSRAVQTSAVVMTESSNKESQDSVTNTPQVVQTIEGVVEVQGISPATWAPSTRVVVDGGRFTGYLKSTGEFKVHNMPPGTYLVEVISPNYAFDPVRVDISSKTGKVRARKVNLIKMASVSHLPYPLKFTAKTQSEFFDKREQWSWLDTLKNPMVRGVHIVQGELCI